MISLNKNRKSNQKNKDTGQRKFSFRQNGKRHLSLFMASVFILSSLSGIGNVFSAATVLPEDKLYYEIFEDTQSKLASTDIEFPLVNEYPGFVRHNGFCNATGQTDAGRRSYEYVLNTGYRTSENKIAYPGQQIICVEHLGALPNKNGAIFKQAGDVDTGVPMIQSYGLAFMMGNYAAHWEDYDKKIPHEPRIDILTHNKDFEAYTDPTKPSTGGNGGNTFIPVKPPEPEEQNFNTRLVFTMRTDDGKEPEYHYLVAGQEKETVVEYLIVSVKPTATNPNLTLNDLDFGELKTTVKSDAEAYAYTEVGFNESKFVAVIPYFQYGGQVYTIPPSAFASLKEDGFDEEMINDPTYGIKSIDLSNAGANFPNLSDTRASNSAYFLVRLMGEVLKTDHPDDAWNSRNLIIKDESPNGLTGPDIWKEKSEPFTYHFNQDLGKPFPYVDENTKAKAKLFSFSNLFGSDSGDYSAVDGTSETTGTETKEPNLLQKAMAKVGDITSANFKNMNSLKLETGDYAGKAFATSYTKSPYWDKYTNAEYYNAFYSLLSICTYNYYSNNNLFTYKIGDTYVPRYFSGSGIGAKTAVADLNYQGSTATQPAWSMPTFRNRHGDNYIFAGDIQGAMPNGRSASENGDRMVLLAEYINNKMTRDILPPKLQDIPNLDDSVNNPATFSSPLTWNTSITKKYGDPADIAKLYHFNVDDPNASETMVDASFIYGEGDDGKAKMSTPADYMLVGPFYAHTDYPESRMTIGFTENIATVGYAERGDEVIMSDEGNYADYVILTSEAIVNNMGQSGTDRRKTELYGDELNNRFYPNPDGNGEPLMQSYEIVNGNVPLKNVDLGIESEHPNEVVRHEPTYWDGVTTPKDLYNDKYNVNPKDPKYIINNWGRGEFYIAIRKDPDLIYNTSIPRVTVGMAIAGDTLTQVGYNLTGSEWQNKSSNIQRFLISDTAKVVLRADMDLELRLANIDLHKANEYGELLEKKTFVLYTLADRHPELPESDPNRYEWIICTDTSGQRGQQNTDLHGNVSYGGLIPGWYMLYEKVDYSFRKVSYLQTCDTENEPERLGVPITIDIPAGNQDGTQVNDRIVLPEGARTAATPVEDPDGINPDHAGDIFYVDNGKVKGINLEGATVMDYHVYSNVENDPIAFFKEVGDINKLVDEDGNYLNISDLEYQRNIQFVFQAEEDKSVYYVAPVRNGKVNMFQARIVQGDFPDKYEWTPLDAGQPVDVYWWINSEHVRVEERINPALGISKKQIDYITSFVDSGGYTMDFLKYSNPLNNGRETFVNNIEEVPEPVILKIVKKDAETAETIPEVAFTLKSRNGKYVATSTTNRKHSTIKDAYVTDENGELTFQIYSEDKEELAKMLRAQWVLEEVEAATGYGEQTYVKSLNWLGSDKTFDSGDRITLPQTGEEAIEYTLEARNYPEEEIEGKIELSKEWVEKDGSTETPMVDPPEAVFNLYRGTFGDTKNLVKTITISANTPTFSLEELQLDNYWIEEVNIPEGMSVSYSPGQAFTLTENKPEIKISVKNTDDVTQKEYTVSIAKKQSKMTTMQGTPESNFTNIPYYEGPAQFEVRYVGDNVDYQGWMTTITYDRSEQESTGYMKFKVPTYGNYSIEEINFPDTFYPEIQVVGTTTWSTFGDGARFTFHVPDNPGEAPALTLKVVNNRPATMEIVKKDRDTDARIWDENMELQMYAANPDGSRSGRKIGLPQKMGDDGKFVFSSVDYQYTVGDTVWFVETVPPISADDIQYEAEEFSVVASQDLVYSMKQVEFYNQITKYDFNIHKEGPNGEAIQGAAFEIFSDETCTKQVAYGESDQNGDVDIKLPAGTYYVKETYVPEPYKLDSKPFEITLGMDMVETTKTVVNKPEYKVVVKKVDSITKYGVEDVDFNLLDSNKKPVVIDSVEVKGTTDGTGYVIWNVTGTKYLYVDNNDTMYLEETDTNKGYFIKEEIVPIDIKTTQPSDSGITEGAYTFEVENDAKYKARVKKTEVLDKRPATPAETPGISGITFEVYKRGENGAADTLIGTYETDSTGVFETIDLRYGEYYAKEILPKDSIYVTTDEEIPLKIYQMNSLGQFADDNWSTYNLVQNKRKTGSITLEKKSNEGKLLSNVGFTLYHYDGQFNPSKFDPDDCTMVEQKFTDESGKLSFTDLELGNYWLVETETPTTYIGVDPIYITINTDDEDYQVGDLIGQHIQLNIVNNRVPLTLRIVKKDAADSKPIQGAVFSLTLNGKPVSGTTNTDGILEFNNLIRGETYTLVEESVPAPYKVDSTPIQITTHDSDILITKEVFNSTKPAKIQVYKYEKGNLQTPIEGAEFRLILDGEQIGETKFTDKNGMIEWDGLAVSQNYFVQEISVPDPYILNDGLRPIAFDEEENIYFCRVNVPNDVKDYYVRLLKIDGDTKDKLAGAEFDLYMEDKTTKINTQPIVTDSNGLTSTIKVPGPGIYYFKETKAPPNYQLDDRFIEVQAFTEGNEVNIPIFENYKTPKYSIEVTKIDSTTKDVIAGAEFTLYDSERNIVETKVVPDSGKIKFTVEELGIYYLRETKAPTGYELNTTEYKIEVNKDQAIYVQTVENTKKKHIIKVIKQDADDKTPLGEAVFEVFDAQYNKLGELTTTLPDGSGTFEVTGDGIFYLKEKVSPDGYEIITGYIQVKVDAETNVVEKTVYNEKLPEFWIKIYKKDRVGDLPLAGAVFDVYKSDKVTKIGTITTEEPNGFASIQVPEEGNYFLKEVKAPVGYEPIEGFIEVTVGRDSNIIEKTIYNDKQLFIKVIKKDKENDTPLENAIFEVYKEDKVTKIGTITTTLPDGSASIKVPSAGKYFLKEIKAPDGYILDSQWIEVDVDGTVYIVTKTVYNEQEEDEFFIKVIKKDKDSTVPLADAKFDVYKEDKVTKIGTITTTLPNGSASIRVPEPGKYFLKEVEAPTGYVLQEGFIEVNVDGTTNVVEKTIYNEEEKEYFIKVIKKDEISDAPLGDAVFEVFKEDKVTRVGIIKTSLPNGSGSLKVPEPGKYFLKEIEAPAGYILKEGFIEVNVDKVNNVVEKTIYNEEEKEYFIKVIKEDSDNHVPLSDAVFDVYKDDKVTKVGTITTTLPNGSASIKVPGLGTYYLKEVKAPEGYILKEGFIEVTVDGTTNVVEKTIYNEKEKEKEYIIKIYKKDQDSNASLGEAVFDVYEEDKVTKIGTITTTLPNGSGSLIVKEPGKYYLKEVKAPDGYILVSGFIEITVDEAVNVVEKTIYNEKDRDYVINIIKKDRTDNSLLPNVVFDVYKSDKTTKVGTITTSSNGTGSLTVKEAGTYFLKEVQAPSGYIIASDFIQVAVDKDNPVVNLNVYNTKENKEYFLHIYKKDVTNNAPLADATFEVYDKDYVLIGTITTTLPNGDATIKVPNPGIYYLKEVKAPDGYILKSGFISVTVGSTTNVVEKTIYNEKEDDREYWIKVYKKDIINNAPLADAKFEVFTENNISLGTFTTTLPNGEGTFKVPSPGIYYLKEIKAPEGYTLKQGFIPVTVSKNNNVVETTIYNEKPEEEKYILKVYKKDTTNKAPLEHAVIGVYDSNYKQIGTITTTIPDGSGYFEVDYPGQFYLKEIQAPKGYILKEGYIPVTVNSNTNIVETSIYNEKDEETVYNLITVYKVDQDDNPLKGVKIGLYDKKGKLLETGYTDKKGIVKFEDLDDGTYYVEEIEGLVGYEEFDDQIKVVVSDGDSKKVTITNKAIVTEDNAWLSIKKYIDGSTTPLAGVEFTITGANGYKSVQTTDNLGSIYISVPVGQYTVTETKGVEGYQMDSTPRTVQAVKGSVANEVVFYNKPANGTLVITKIDATTSAKLSGASFDIIDVATNTTVRSVTTDASGTASVTLPFGSYQIVETQAPTGYILDVQNSKTVEISAQSTLQKITIENSTIPVVVKPPKTGITPGSMSAGVLFTVSLLSGLILILLNQDTIKLWFRRNEQE